MPEAGALPTRKDEAWRYAAVEALQGVALDDWRTITVARGDALRECVVVEDRADGAEGTVLHRLRVTVREGARCELFAVIAAELYARVEIEVTLGRGQSARRRPDRAFDAGASFEHRALADDRRADRRGDRRLPTDRRPPHRSRCSGKAA
jgi:hypothetical protein